MGTWRRRLCMMLAVVLVGCAIQPTVSVNAEEVIAQNTGLLGASSAKTPFEKYGKLSVKGSQLVDKKGKVTAKKAGTAVITMKTDGKTYQCRVCVNNKA